MAHQLFIGLSGEGSTDSRFLKEIIEKTFTEQAYHCHRDVVIEGVRDIGPFEGSFVERMLNAAKECQGLGINVLCIHADADDETKTGVMAHKFTPFQNKLATMPEKAYCKQFVPLIPVRMTEAWMLADIGQFQERIGATSLSRNELGIDRFPEAYADPKAAIKNALRIAQMSRTRRRRNDLTIQDLYEEMGQLLSLVSLRNLPSFRDFEEGVSATMRQLGLME